MEIENIFKSDSVILRLMLIPVFANEPGTMKIHINERTFFNNAVSFSVKGNDSPITTLYPDIEKIWIVNFHSLIRPFRAMHCLSVKYTSNRNYQIKLITKNRIF